jgi:hypothetical protein
MCNIAKSRQQQGQAQGYERIMRNLQGVANPLQSIGNIVGANVNMAKNLLGSLFK